MSDIVLIVSLVKNVSSGTGEKRKKVAKGIKGNLIV